MIGVMVTDIFHIFYSSSSRGQVMCFAMTNKNDSEIGLGAKLPLFRNVLGRLSAESYENDEMLWCDLLRVFGAAL